MLRKELGLGLFFWFLAGFFFSQVLKIEYTFKFVFLFGA